MYTGSAGKPGKEFEDGIDYYAPLEKEIRTTANST